ncbi:hypothetical protein PI124_g1147 [Phytophthora idaei]|nr:hypothetical protein PI124_g1147 [Phytophthora idaei]
MVPRVVVTEDVAAIVAKTPRCHRREETRETRLHLGQTGRGLHVPGEAGQLLKALDELREAAHGATVRRFKVVEEEERVAVGQDVEADRGTVAAEVDGVAVKALLLDSVADTSTVARGVLDVLQRAGKAVTVDSVNGVRLDPVDGHGVDVRRRATHCEVVLTTSASPLMLRNLACYVEKGNASMKLTVGRPIMKRFGYSTDKLLVGARDACPEWEAGELKSESCDDEASPTTLHYVYRLQVVDSDSQLTDEAADDIDRHETRTAPPTLHPTTLAEVIVDLKKKVEVATKMGLTLDGQAKLRAIVQARADCFRVQFGNDPPVRGEPMQVRLKPDATPVKVQPCRYSPNDRAFLDRRTAALIKLGLVYNNHRSRRASAPRIVRKREQDTDPVGRPKDGH